jgi:hypothetical protein
LLIPGDEQLATSIIMIIGIDEGFPISRVM